MKEFKFDGYALMGADGDGRGEHLIAYFDSYGVAEEIRGGDHYKSVREKSMTVRVYESAAEYRAQVEIKARETALAKLTPADRKALGLE